MSTDRQDTPRRFRRTAALLVSGALLATSAVGAARVPAGAGGLPDPIVVTTTADVVDAGDGETSLREAFTAASGDPLPDTIQLAAGEEYVLDHCDASPEDANASGDLDHPTGGSLTVQGNGATVRQACAGERVLHVQTTTTLHDLTLTGGDVVGQSGPDQLGGAVFSNQPIHLVDVALVGNQANQGGGVFGTSLITLLRTLVSGNTATSTATAVYGNTAANDVIVTDSSIVGNQGFNLAVSSARHLHLTNSTVAGNTGTWNSGSAGLVLAVGDLVLDHATVAGNSLVAGSTLRAAGDLVAEASAVGNGLAAECVVGGETISHGGNVEATDTCGLDDPADRVDAGDLRLGPPRDNGSLPTAFPLAGSPVVDVVAGCPAEVDQRGVDRPFPAGGACDAGAVEQVYPAHGLSDVPAWVEDAVRWITATVNDPPLMTGYPNGTFRPDLAITRAQVVRLLYREAGSPAGPYPPHGFSDVPAWVEEAVRWAVAEDIVTGYPNGTFRPDLAITRAQVVRMKYRLAGQPDVSGLPPHGFSDVPAWVVDAVRWAADTTNPLPLVTGYPNGTFRPDLDITRGQVARMDYRLAITPEAWDDPATAPPTLPFVAPT